MGVSESGTLQTLAQLNGIITLGLGLNALLRPQAALSLFGFPLPTAPSDATTVMGLMLVYGVRDMFMGVATLATARYGSRVACGITLVSTAAVAIVDGFASLYVLGEGQWAHWTLTPLIAGLGVALMGAFD